MSTEFVGHDIWPRLTKAVRGSRQRSAVAVAYFGAGAGRLLPLSSGSRLVVDASERAVASGQTCPADLLALVKRGVAVYSVANLHAKVFVLGRAAYIGSTNVSARSAAQLVEAVVRTTEPEAVQAAREFVREHCRYELTPTVLKRLAKLYRPPRVPGGKPGKRTKDASAERPVLPRLLLVRLELEDWPESDQALHDAALPVARKRRKHPRAFTLDSFRIVGPCPYRRDDVVVQIIDEGDGKVMVAPLANVLHLRTRRTARRQVSFVYVEHPNRRRRSLESVAKKLGRGSRAQLKRNGLVRNAALKEALWKLWA